MLKVIKRSDYQILDIATVKQHLRIEHDHEDDYIKFLIESATEILEKQIGFSILQKKYKYTGQNFDQIPIFTVVEVFNRSQTSVIFTAGIAKTPNEVPTDIKYATLQIVKAMYECSNEDIMQMPIIHTIIMDYRSCA